jgi:hypothetical protein
MIPLAQSAGLPYQPGPHLNNGLPPSLPTSHPSVQHGLNTQLNIGPLPPLPMCTGIAGDGSNAETPAVQGSSAAALSTPPPYSTVPTTNGTMGVNAVVNSSSNAKPNKRNKRRGHDPTNATILDLYFYNDVIQLLQRELAQVAQQGDQTGASSNASSGFRRVTNLEFLQALARLHLFQSMRAQDHQLSDQKAAQEAADWALAHRRVMQVPEPDHITSEPPDYADPVGLLIKKKDHMKWASSPPRKNKMSFSRRWWQFRRDNLPFASGMIQRIEWPKLEKIVYPDLVRNGSVVQGANGRPLRALPGWPDEIDVNIHGSFLDALQQSAPGWVWSDVLDRLCAPIGHSCWPRNWRTLSTLRNNLQRRVARDDEMTHRFGPGNGRSEFPKVNIDAVNYHQGINNGRALNYNSMFDLNLARGVVLQPRSAGVNIPDHAREFPLPSNRPNSNLFGYISPTLKEATNRGGKKVKYENGSEKQKETKKKRAAEKLQNGSIVLATTPQRSADGVTHPAYESHEQEQGGEAGTSRENVLCIAQTPFEDIDEIPPGPVLDQDWFPQESSSELPVVYASEPAEETGGSVLRALALSENKPAQTSPAIGETRHADQYLNHFRGTFREMLAGVDAELRDLFDGGMEQFNYPVAQQRLSHHSGLWYWWAEYALLYYRRNGRLHEHLDEMRAFWTQERDNAGMRMQMEHDLGLFSEHQRGNQPPAAEVEPPFWDSVEQLPAQQFRHALESQWTAGNEDHGGNFVGPCAAELISPAPVHEADVRDLPFPSPRTAPSTPSTSTPQAGNDEQQPDAQVNRSKKRRAEEDEGAQDEAPANSFDRLFARPRAPKRRRDREVQPGSDDILLYSPALGGHDVQMDAPEQEQTGPQMVDPTWLYPQPPPSQHPGQQQPEPEESFPPPSGTEANDLGTDIDEEFKRQLLDISSETLQEASQAPLFHEYPM